MPPQKPIAPSTTQSLRCSRRHWPGLLALLADVLEVVRIPVLAAGGIGTGRQLAAVLTAGADGARIGTRFVAAEGSLSPLHIAEPCWRGQCRAMDGNPATLAFAALTFLLGGLVKGVIGVGVPVIKCQRSALAEHIQRRIAAAVTGCGFNDLHPAGQRAKAIGLQCAIGGMTPG